MSLSIWGLTSVDPSHPSALATFNQFFTESDPAEVDRRGFTMTGFLAAIIVFFTAFQVLGDADKGDRKLRPMALIGYSLVIIVIATCLGAFLMPLHIPNGH